LEFEAVGVEGDGTEFDAPVGILVADFGGEGGIGREAEGSAAGCRVFDDLIDLADDGFIEEDLADAAAKDIPISEDLGGTAVVAEEAAVFVDGKEGIGEGIEEALGFAGMSFLMSDRLGAKV